MPAVDNNNAIVNFNENNLTNSFNFKVKMTGQTGDDVTKNVEIMVPLNCLSNFWRTLEIPLINCEINLCKSNATFEITDAKLYVPVVTLSIKDNAKLLQ